MVCASEGDDSKDTNCTPFGTMTNAKFIDDECDQVLSIDDLSDVSGGGLAAVAGWAVLNLVTAGIPAMIDLTNGSPYAKEALESKY